MNARSLVFEVGDRVTGSGQVFRGSDLDANGPVDADGVWLDLAWTHSLIRRNLRRPDLCVRLTGADLDAVPTEFGPDTVPGRAIIAGIWLGDTIEVQSQSPAPPGFRFRWEWTTPPCPPPAGGRFARAQLDDVMVRLKRRPLEWGSRA